MKSHAFFFCILGLLIGLLFPGILFAQRGDIIIPIGASITVPMNAQICADRIFANNPGYGNLTLADPSGICAGAVVTPVELLVFSAALQNDVVLLSLTTATETRNYGFEIHRETERDAFTTLGFIPGSGSTTEQHSYGFTDDLRDLPAYCCELRYRLKQIDLDGRHEYSTEVELRLDAPLPGFALTAYPSPCDDALTVHLTLGEAGTASIRLHDIAGRVVLTIAQDAILPAGSHSMRVRTSDVPTGLYLLMAECREGRRTEKVLMQH